MLNLQAGIDSVQGHYTIHYPHTNEEPELPNSLLVVRPVSSDALVSRGWSSHALMQLALGEPGRSPRCIQHRMDAWIDSDTAVINQSDVDITLVVSRLGLSNPNYRRSPNEAGLGKTETPCQRL